MLANEFNERIRFVLSKGMRLAHDSSTRRPGHPIGRFLAIGFLLCTLSIASSAYTLVLRDGRRLEIPAKFRVTQKTLTYEAGPAINVTLMLSVVDVAATERANNEPAGSFFKHAEPDQAAALPRVEHARSAVTNRELEPVRRARLESEQAYEKRRLELGLPSAEESRQRQEQEEQNTLALIRARESAQAADEAYWRQRAGALRGEITAVDAQINYLRARLGEIYEFPLATHSLVTGVLPLVPLANRSAVVPPRAGSNGVFGAPRTDAVRGGTAAGGQALINPARPFRPSIDVRPPAGFGFGSSFAFPFGSAFPFALPVRPFTYLEDSYQRAELSERLEDLLVTRAGLAARWRELEDEARDAKVPQVWLEP